MTNRIIIACFFLILLLASCVDGEDVIIEIEDEEFQLLYSNNSPQDYWYKISVIRFFKSVALGSEFGDDFPVVRKWKEPMQVFLYGEGISELFDEAVGVIQEINELTVDNFEVVLVENRENANFIIYLGSAEGYMREFPGTSLFINDNKGLFTIHHNENFEIYKGHMFVDTEKSLATEGKHLLREELTQSLGLTNDIPHHIRSIFYENWSSTISYTELDMEIIRLLYHAKIIPGLDDQSVQNVLETILGLN